MKRRRLFYVIIVALLASSAGLLDFGCGESGPETGGAGIPGVKGPASPKTNAFPKGGVRPGARTAGPAKAPAPKAVESE
jgi:hypothetical protein